jgi:hypothetical protein
MPQPTDRIVEFYRGGTDDRGRTFDEILAWSDEQLEAVHDYIQWLFPTAAPSHVNPHSPIVGNVASRAFASEEPLRAKMRSALDRMLRFYGLHRTEDGRIEMDPASFPQRSRVWLKPWNHNHLRLTRIMQSLGLLGAKADARALQRCLLEDICTGPGQGQVTPETVDYWQHAVG